MQRDEFFWISEINKASVVANSRSGLLEPTIAKEAAGGIKALDAAAEADPPKRVKRYIGARGDDASCGALKPGHFVYGACSH